VLADVSLNQSEKARMIRAFSVEAIQMKAV
jgi:hypothetical protein